MHIQAEIVAYRNTKRFLTCERTKRLCFYFVSTEWLKPPLRALCSSTTPRTPRQPERSSARFAKRIRKTSKGEFHHCCSNQSFELCQRIRLRCKQVPSLTPRSEITIKGQVAGASRQSGYIYCFIFCWPPSAILSAQCRVPLWSD